MSDTAVPAAPAPTAPVATQEPRKLDDVLLAMDVVDTLRHRERVVDQELNAEERETQLIARLKEIYGAQGIEVPERILKDGVKALEEQRFVYKPPPPGFGVSIAKLWINRGRWGPVAGVFALIVLAGGAFGWFSKQQGDAEMAALPTEISRALADGQALAIDPSVDAQLASIAAEAQREVANKDQDGAKAQLATLTAMNAKLAQEYDIRIVTRPNQMSGVWRYSNKMPGQRNYYLIVEAVAPGGRVLSMPITNEEDNKTKTVSEWGQRVTKDTFDKVAAEKSGSGVIINNILGHKARGELNVKYDAPTPEGAITEW
ncbi:MAG TPA: DUF6384 family protein [Hyphomonadaceae bacterium]|nr:DUF6384 family protein [Hyphomonadaceae bacterium]